MAIATIDFVIDVQFDKAPIKKEKFLFITTETSGPPPLDIYIDFTEFHTGKTSRRCVYQGTARFVHLGYSIAPSDIDQVKGVIMRYLAELSNQGWKVRQASHHILACLDKLGKTGVILLDSYPKKLIPYFQPLTISTIDEP